MKRFTILILTIAICFGVLAPVAISVAPSGVAIQSSVVSAATATTTEDASTQLWNNISCGVGFWGDGSLAGCIAAILYFIPYWVGGELLSLSARFFDITAAYTLSSSLISSSSFVRDGWRTTRDFANVFFIFILLYIAVSLVLGLGSKDTNPKKMIISVVIVALMINFSLFFTEVVIDLSNTTALVFYNQIKVNQTSMDPAVAELSAVAPDVKPKGLSESIAQAFRPHTLQSPEFYKALQDKDSGQVPAGRLIVILLSIGAMYVAAAVAFFVSALSFMGRLIQFWLLIIFAPFALVTYIVPALRKNEKLGFLSWSNWVGSLMSTAVAAPIFFFFLFLISVLAQSALFTGFTTSFSTAGAANSGNWISLMLEILIPTVMIFTMLTMATKYAKKASGTLGELAVKGGMMALGAAGGLALAGAAKGGQQTLGRLGQRLARSETLKNMATSDNRFKQRFAESTLKVSSGAAKSSFMLPGSKAGGLAEKGLSMAGLEGLKFATGGIAGIGSAAAMRGGIEAATKRREEKQKKMAESLGYDKDKQARIDKQMADKQNAITKITEDLAVATAQRDSQVAGSAGRAAAAATVNRLTQELKELRVGKNTDTTKYTSADVGVKKKANGEYVKYEDVGRQANQYFKDDILKKTRKADGTLVTQEDIDKNRTALREGEVGLNELTKLSDSNKKVRAATYLNNKLKKRGYEVRGTKTDALGNITDAGYLNYRAEARNWKAAVKDKLFTKEMATSVVGSTLSSAAIGASIGSVVPIVGTGLGAAAGAAYGAVRNSYLNEFRREIAENMDVNISRGITSKTNNMRQSWNNLSQTIRQNVQAAMGGNPLSGGGAQQGTSSTGGAGSGTSGSSGGTSSTGASQGQTQNQTAGATTP